MTTALRPHRRVFLLLANVLSVSGCKRHMHPVLSDRALAHAPPARRREGEIKRGETLTPG